MNKDTKEVYEYSLLIEQGILLMHKNFQEGNKGRINYDFACKEYDELKEKYNLEQIAGKGSSFQKAKRLLNYFSSKLAHKSDYDNHIACNSLALLEYSFNNPEHGINCLNKSKIIVELCLAIGIKARRVSIMPYSPYDMDNHVIAEIFDEKLKKWIMMDPTTNGFFIDENKTPLSMFEIRKYFAENKFLTFVACGEKTNNLTKLKEKHLETNWYICKNSFRFVVENYQGFGHGKNEIEVFNFYPTGFSIKKWEMANAKYKLDYIEKHEMRDLMDWARKNYEKTKNLLEAVHYSIETLYE